MRFSARHGGIQAPSHFENASEGHSLAWVSLWGLSPSILLQSNCFSKTRMGMVKVTGRVITKIGSRHHKMGNTSCSRPSAGLSKHAIRREAILVERRICTYVRSRRKYSAAFCSTRRFKSSDYKANQHKTIENCHASVFSSCNRRRDVASCPCQCSER
jgi:hypothetical protein